jgi:hypothetical protein
MTTLHVKDSGALRVFRELKMTISGGVHEEEGNEQHDKGPLTVVEVAAVNEFGGGKIPARMWLRGWVPKGSRLFVQLIRNAMVNMARTQRYESGPFERITADLATSIRGRLLEGLIQPANAPLTLHNKAPETRPLVEHGQLAEAIRGQLTATAPSGGINWRAKT